LSTTKTTGVACADENSDSRLTAWAGVISSSIHRFELWIDAAQVVAIAHEQYLSIGKGAVPATDGFCSDSSAVRLQFGIVPVGENTSMCASTDSMRSRTSLLYSFMVESTMLSEATPGAMPAIDTTAMNETRPLPVVRLSGRI
jgi:hypothetical protein